MTMKYKYHCRVSKGTNGAHKGKDSRKKGRKGNGNGRRSQGKKEVRATSTTVASSFGLVDLSGPQVVKFAKCPLTIVLQTSSKQTHSCGGTGSTVKIEAHRAWKGWAWCANEGSADRFLRYAPLHPLASLLLALCAC